MKKTLVFAALLVVWVAQAWAGGFGNVRIPFDPDVGWVNLNTTGSGKLLVTVHLDDGLPNEEFGVSLRVRYEDGTTEVFQDVAVLSTNADGKGTVHVQVKTNPPPGDTTLRRVAVRVRRAPQPLYLAVAWDVPLKKRPPGFRGRVY